MAKSAAPGAGQVRLRKQGKWWHARYTIGSRRMSQSLKVTNLVVAEKKAREIAELLERGEYAVLQDRKAYESMTFAKLLDDFRANHSGWSPSTWQGANSILGRLEAEFGELPLTGFTPRLVESDLARRRDQDGITGATANRYLSVWKAVFKMAVRWGYVGFNPAEPIKATKEASHIPEALSDEQLEQVLAVLKPHVRLLTELYADTGLRASELKGLLWKDVDLEQGAIRVAKPKNKEFRVIPMTERVRGIFTELHRDNVESKTPRIQAVEWIDIRAALHNAGVKVGVGHIHPHMLRHTFATRLRDRGVPLDRIKELLGHKSMQMVLRYAKARPQQLEEAIAALNGFGA